MGKVLVVLLSAVVVVELIAVIALAAALFWISAGVTIAVGAGMLSVAVAAVLLTLRGVRPHG